MDEFELIKYLTSPRTPRTSHTSHTSRAPREKRPAHRVSERLAIGIGDDAAVGTMTPGNQIVMTCDTMVETIHFSIHTMLDEDIGYKALAANISDIAAMGGVPLYALVAVSAPKRWSSQRLRRIYDGLYSCAEQFHVEIAGGDTTYHPRHLTITVTLIGEVEADQALQRSAAASGDLVFVTGYPGRSAGGLHFLQALGERAKPLESYPEDVRSLCQAHRRPEPRVEVGRILLAHGGHALNDISDGIASEAYEIAEASGATLRLSASQMPLDPLLVRYAAQCGMDPMRFMLGGGEDFELIGTLPANHVADVQKKMDKLGIPFHVIGMVVSDEAASVEWEDERGHITKLNVEGYRHFK